MVHQQSSGAGPVFLIGTGRCGSTIVDSLLAMHPDLSWMPSWIDTARGWPILALGNRIWHISAMDRFIESRFFPTPVEPYDTFRRYAKHFSSETIDAPVVAEARERLVPLIEKIRKFHGRPRYLAKFVGRPVKVELFAKLYPDARFVHVVRGLKPTLSSLMKVHFYADWGPIENWQWEKIPQSYLDFFEKTNRAEEVGAAIRLKLNREQIDRQLAAIDPFSHLQVSYGDFVRDPICQLREICDFCELPIHDSYIQRVRRRKVYSGADDKWKRHFDENQIRRLDEFEDLAGYN